MAQIQCCHGCDLGHSYSSDLTPGQELPYAAGVAVEKKVANCDQCYEKTDAGLKRTVIKAGREGCFFRL